MNDDKNVKSNNDEVKTPVDDEKDSDVKVAPTSKPDDDEKVAPTSTSTVINNNTQNYNSITVNTAELVQAQLNNSQHRRACSGATFQHVKYFRIREKYVYKRRFKFLYRRFVQFARNARRSKFTRTEIRL